MDKVQIYQELERRGELGKLPAEKQAIWAEYKRRQSSSAPAETPGQKAWNSFKEDIADLTYAPRKALSGATLGASDWVLRKLGVNNYEDTENRMGEVSPLAKGLTKVGGFGAELGGNIGGLGGGLVKYLAGKGLKGLKLATTAGGIEGGITGGFSGDTLEEAGTNALLGLGVGAALPVGIKGLSYLPKAISKPFSASMQTKGMKGGLNNVVENPEAVKVLNQGIKQSDDVASEFLLKSRPVARGINKETASMVDSALTSRIDVPETIKEANARYGQYMDEHGADEVFNLAIKDANLDKKLANISKQMADNRTKLNKLNLSKDKGLNFLSDKPILSLNKRLSGNDLEDAFDLIDLAKTRGATVDDNGYITLYHRTTPEAFDKIKNTKKMLSKENDNGVYFSTNKNGQADGFGDSVVEIKAPIEKAILDDDFGNELHFKLLGDKNGLDVSKYLNAEKENINIIDILNKEYDVLSGDIKKVQDAYNKLNERNVVNSKLPHINSLYDGLTEFQGKSLKNALNTGFSKTNAKRGSLESLNKVKQEINEQIKKAMSTEKPSEVWQLEELKHKFDNAMPEGLKVVDKGYERAKRLENAFERGTHYNPNNVEGADYISELSPLEQNAFAQGLFKRINNNSLTGKNLANTALGYENTLASVLRGDKYDDLMKGLNKQSTKFERLAGLGRKAESKLNTPEAQRFFGREQLESKGSMIGSALDWLNTKFRHDALERAGKNLLNPNYNGELSWIAKAVSLPSDLIDKLITNNPNLSAGLSTTALSNMFK